MVNTERAKKMINTATNTSLTPFVQYSQILFGDKPATKPGMIAIATNAPAISVETGHRQRTKNHRRQIRPKNAVIPRTSHVLSSVFASTLDS